MEILTCSLNSRERKECHLHCDDVIANHAANNFDRVIYFLSELVDPRKDAEEPMCGL